MVDKGIYDEPIKQPWRRRILHLVDEWKNDKIDAGAAAEFILRYFKVSQTESFLSVIPIEFVDVYRSWIDYHDERAINGNPGYYFGPDEYEDRILAIFDLLRSDVPSVARGNIESMGCYCRATADGGMAVTASHKSVTDSVVKTCCTPGFPSLQRINLDGSSVSDKGFEFLSTQHGLKELYLRRTTITGSGMASLHAPQLSDLRLSGCQQLDVANLNELRRFPNLEVLLLDDTHTNDLVAEHIGSLSHLRLLVIGNTSITDDGLSHFQKLTKLKRLDLNNTRVTDEGLIHLKNLSEVVRLEIDGSQITEEGFERLRLHLPKLKDDPMRKRRFAASK